MEIENDKNTLIVWGDFLDYYDEESDDFFPSVPFRWENGVLVEVDKEGVAIDKLEGFKFYVLDGLGQIEKVYE